MSVAEPPTISPVAELEADELFEIIDGVRVESPPMSAYANRIANRLANAMNAYADPNQVGEAVVEVLFRLPLARGQNRRPDLAFVSAGRWPTDQPMPMDGNAWDVVPDLAVEVVSPTDRIEELDEKLAEYFEAGVRTVWVIHPKRKYAQVYKSLTEIHGLLEADELDGGNILPGFKIRVGKLLPPSA